MDDALEKTVETECDDSRYYDAVCGDKIGDWHDSDDDLSILTGPFYEV